MIRLEACVDSVEGMLAALAGGADRIELCSALEVGGLTPSSGQMRKAAVLPLPVHALIRSRAGDFCFCADEIGAMIEDIRTAGEVGLAGVVIGVARQDGTLDVEVLSRMVEAAGPMSVTLHRVFDLVPDFERAVEEAIELGCDRILTSGGAVDAPTGVDTIAKIAGMAAGRIGILPAAGITAKNVMPLLCRLPVKEIHSACAVERPLDIRAVELGFGHPTRFVTSTEEVRALKAALAIGR